MQRTITITSNAVETGEGAGARVRRALPSPRITEADPFILLDEFFVEPSAGFPEHPHRGFEIVTYLLEGGLRHQDSLGNDSAVTAGGLMRIDTGAGIRHSEMPAAEGLTRGLQLWVNLPRELKTAQPAYEAIGAERIPETAAGGYRVRTIVGGDSPLSLHTPVLYLDVSVEPGTTWSANVPEAYRGFIYILSGEGRFGANSSPGKPGQLLELGQGDTVQAEAPTGQALRFALIAGRPHGEPIRLRGPFVD